MRRLDSDYRLLFAHGTEHPDSWAAPYVMVEQPCTREQHSTFAIQSMWHRWHYQTSHFHLFSDHVHWNGKLLPLGQQDSCILHLTQNHFDADLDQQPPPTTTDAAPLPPASSMTLSPPIPRNETTRATLQRLFRHVSDSSDTLFFASYTTNPAIPSV
jgi:hypothetical protein